MKSFLHEVKNPRTAGRPKADRFQAWFLSSNTVINPGQMMHKQGPQGPTCKGQGWREGAPQEATFGPVEDAQGPSWGECAGAPERSKENEVAARPLKHLRGATV